MEIIRLNATHYDALLSLLNTVFSRKNNREMDFEKEIPKMWVRDDVHMGCHFGIFENGSLVAAMGVYPFTVTVGTETLRFATTGNIAVRPDCEGKGYMGALMDRAMTELDRLGIDVARLGGLRSRYNRYGFDSCGQNYSFTFTEKNRTRKFPHFKGGISFQRIAANDKETLAFASSLYNANALAVPRTPETAYVCMTMWQNVPFLATRNGTKIGYLCANAAKTAIAECNAIDTAALTDMICAWQELTGAPLSFYRQAHQIESIRVFSAVCETSNCYAPSHFLIRNWEKTVDAFMKLKEGYAPLPTGELTVKIIGYGTLCLYKNETSAGCRLCDEIPNVTLEALDAARYLFGPYPPFYTAEATPTAQAFLPLPLSWNTLDRV